ncbi:MAG: cobalt-precorrin-5B (C(1))-methyltransferase, partial [Geobacteraceae bacterium]|nr:cobalt-precorrin-5B (C(1))-methyltransferase [Geobacteraceae bacterium]
MKKRDLKHGYTTGACAAAAAKGAALMLRDQALLDKVEIVLPRGETVRFRLQGQEFDRDAASCFVVKDAGDDPDVTHGAEIHARVTLKSGLGADPRVCPGRTHGFAPTKPVTGEIQLEGGAGIGRATKPGLAVAVGEWA